MNEPFVLTFTLFILILVVKIQTVDGKYAFNHMCNHRNPYGTNLYRVGLAKCKRECGARSHCHAVNYFRRERTCSLLLTADSQFSSGGRVCVHVTKEDMKEVNACPCSSIDVCGNASNTCAVKECAQIEKIHNGDVLGNMNHFGSRLKIKCDPGSSEISNRFSTQCLPTGRWSYRPQCIRVTIGDICDSDNDCAESGSVCIEGRCFCGPLYRYNAPMLDCVKVCSRMTNDFTEYPGIFIMGYNIDAEFRDYRTNCIKNPACLSYENFITCCYGAISYVMAIDADPQIIHTNSELTVYSRNCE